MSLKFFLSRFIFTLAALMMTRITSQFERRANRQAVVLYDLLNGTCCVQDTPEGETRGLVKNLALVTHVTTDAYPAMLELLLYDICSRRTFEIGGDEANQNDLGVLNSSKMCIHSQPRNLSGNCDVLALFQSTSVSLSNQTTVSCPLLTITAVQDHFLLLSIQQIETQCTG